MHDYKKRSVARGCSHTADLHWYVFGKTYVFGKKVNLSCVGFRASTIPDAGHRAGPLAVVNIVPLFAKAHLAFFADQLGISL